VKALVVFCSRVHASNIPSNTNRVSRARPQVKASHTTSAICDNVTASADGAGPPRSHVPNTTPVSSVVESRAA